MHRLPVFQPIDLPSFFLHDINGLRKMADGSPGVIVHLGDLKNIRKSTAGRSEPAAALLRHLFYKQKRFPFGACDIYCLSCRDLVFCTWKLSGNRRGGRKKCGGLVQIGHR
ncbi:hypothetical protein GWI33_020656 [Rhynchophorus ferrugineus]|uniref:Uncharacterized protein n=1 Tax=Rhynchophorus ferrugineus TaxID=354439 RepID=A0A834HTX5_RHYFE|nr:hypothetical protein GWI33_020656 [Rhynchophorus ferrugineus]